MTKPSIRPGLYKHTARGSYYLVLGLTQDSTNGETDGRIDVSYVALNPDEHSAAQGVYHRELKQFKESVDAWSEEEHKTGAMPRFEFLGVAPNADELTVSVGMRDLLGILQESMHLKAQVAELQKDNTAHKLEWQEARQRVRTLEDRIEKLHTVDPK